MNDERVLKGLRTQLNNMNSDMELMDVNIRQLQKELSLKREAAKKIKSEMDKYSVSNKPRISEHAIVRYFERVLGYDISDIENKMLSDDVLKQMKILGTSGKFPVDNRFKIVLKDNVVTTVLA